MQSLPPPVDNLEPARVSRFNYTMTEQEHINQLRGLFGDCLASSPEASTAAETAVRAFPNSATLWCLHGCIAMACEDDCAEVVPGALASLERALTIDPNHAETHLALAAYYDGFAEDWSKAEMHSRRAEELSR